MNLRVLFTNVTLAGRTGTEVAVRDLAGAMARRGVNVAVYSPAPGPTGKVQRARMAQLLEAAGGRPA